MADTTIPSAEYADPDQSHSWCHILSIDLKPFDIS